MPNTTTYLNDYKQPSMQVRKVHLNIDLFEEYALVTSKLSIFCQKKNDLHLFGDELELLSIHKNDRALAITDYQLHEDDLIILGCEGEFTLTIVTQIYPQKNTQLSGLYRSNHLFCTQCEAEGFRRITFYPDRPDVLSLFTTRISADKTDYPILLSNGNLVGKGNLESNRHWVEWHDPFKKPSYLFALVAGQLAVVKDDFITCSGKKIALHLYVEKGNEQKCAHALACLKRAMRWDEEVYGREYDLDLFMIVAVSDFNMGAMENKGLNIFNTKYILASDDSATDEDFIAIEDVVAHEYFHNWTGNRVTCRDWFQLSLKEGLTVFREQEFSGDMHSREVKRILDVKMLLNTQFPEDAGAMAHPVQPASYQEINNFYTATIYNKGAEVIRMQHALLGEAGFRRGMDNYFDRFDGQAVTIDDFVNAMETANEIDLKQFKHWYSQAGTPHVEVDVTFKKPNLTLKFTQSCRATPECNEKKAFHIPIRFALFNEEGELLPQENEIIELKNKEEVISFNGLEEKPLVSLLRGFSAPITLTCNQNQKDHLALLRVETDGYAKWKAAQTLAIDCMHSWLKRTSQVMQIPQDLLNAYETILRDDKLDLALRAELLNPPSFEDVLAGLTGIDVTRIENIRDHFRQGLGNHLFEVTASFYEDLWQIEDHAMHQRAYAQRRLRNMCLWLMMKGDETRALSYCQKQFATAQTMTDKVASLSLLIHCSDASRRKDAVLEFYSKWSDNELVLDKWFSLQACGEHTSLEAVETLLQHKDFHLKNPNRVRAVVGAFSQANHRHFHAPDGSGYRFLTNFLIKLDKINPQISARLATPFTRWHRYDTTRQIAMLDGLKALSHQALSNDLREIVVKSLALQEK